MNTENIQRYINSFGQQVVNRAKGILQKKKGGKTRLEKTISFELVPIDEGYSVRFFMADYGTFVDKGVSGTKQTQKFQNYQGKVISSPYKYTNKQPSSRVLDKWIVKKGIAPRDKEGKFLSRKSITFLIARSIGKKGIKIISFFQKPLGLGLKQFGSDLLKNVKEDIIENLNKVTVK